MILSDYKIGQNRKGNLRAKSKGERRIKHTAHGLESALAGMGTSLVSDMTTTTLFAVQSGEGKGRDSREGKGREVEDPMSASEPGQKKKQTRSIANE